MLDSLLVAEIINIGTFDSHMHFSGLAFTKPRYSASYEIELFTEDGGASFVDDVEYPIKKGNLLFVRPNQKRYSKLHFQSWFIRFNLPKGTEFRYFQRIPTCMNVSELDEFIHLFHELAIQFFSEKNGSKLLADSYLMTLFYRIYSSSNTLEQNHAANSNINVAILEAKQFIDENYAQNLTLETIAKYSKFSPIYFHKKFLALFGMTPHEYLLTKRINMAKRLLIASDYSLVKISLDCGFSSQSYFSYAFKKATGMSPQQFRNTATYPDCFENRG